MKKTSKTTGNSVSFCPSPREFDYLKGALHQALDDVGTHGQLILGPKVKAFEREMAALINRDFAVSCASGTDAITLALKSLDITQNDEVILPANAYPSVFGVALSGAKPVLTDIDYRTGSIDSKNIEKFITKKTKAVLVVHLYGLPVNLSQILELCKAHKLVLIEDCAQAAGSTYQEKPVGSFGNMATFSFYPTKNLGALGDGGAVVLDNPTLYSKLLALRMYGENERYNSQFLGMNSRLDELHAAFLLEKMKHLISWVKTRKSYANKYNQALRGVGDLELLPELPDRENSYHLYPIRTSRRDELQQWLYNQGIQTGIHYPRSVHQTITFKKLAGTNQFPFAEKWNEKTLSLPIHPFLTETEIDYVIDMIVTFYK
jgi:UDP-2-acetamido-2-deoxy-ribo-hexuluronate aminotransferase